MAKQTAPQDLAIAEFNLTKSKLEDANTRIGSLNADVQALRDELEETKTKLRDARSCFVKSQEELLDLKKSLDKSNEGFVTIATMPIDGVYPAGLTVNKIEVIRKKDKFGNIYETLPVDTATQILTEGSSFKRYYVAGEKAEIVAVVRKGMYAVKEVIKKHVLNEETGAFELPKVEVPKVEQPKAEDAVIE
jgi:hypothetical protein